MKTFKCSHVWFKLVILWSVVLDHLLQWVLYLFGEAYIYLECFLLFFFCFFVNYWWGWFILLGWVASYWIPVVNAILSIIGFYFYSYKYTTYIYLYIYIYIYIYIHIHPHQNMETSLLKVRLNILLKIFSFFFFFVNLKWRILDTLISTIYL